MITITKNNIASIALLYNYLAHKDSTISSSKVDQFYQKYIDSFNDKYDNSFNFIDELVCENDFSLKNINIPHKLYRYYYQNNSFKSPKKTFETDYLGIVYNNNYSIKEINLLMLNYQLLPDEIVDFSLTETVLDSIDISTDMLRQEVLTKQYDKYIDVSSLSKNRALELAKNIISSYGFFDLNVSDIAHIGQNKHDYRIFYDAKKEYKKVKF